MKEDIVTNIKVNRELWQEFSAQAAKQGLTKGEALQIAIHEWAEGWKTFKSREPQV